MSAVLRICVVLCMAHLAACDSILGIHKIVPDEPPSEPPPDPATRPAMLSFVSVPSKGIAQQALGGITVIVQDSLGRPVNSSGMEIRLSLRDDRATAQLLGTLTAMVDSDTASFYNVSVDRPGTGYTLVADADGLMPATSPLDVLGTFTLLPAGDGGSISTITVSPAPPGGTTTLFAVAGHGVYTSRDDGMTWTASGTGGNVVEARVAADPQRPGVAYLASRLDYRGRLLKTEDGGASWRAVGIDIGASITSIAIDPKDTSTIYAVDDPGDSRALLRSTDGGTRWSRRGLPGACYLIEIDPITTSNLYCFGWSDGVYKSSNAGVSWVSANTGFGETDVPRMFATPNALFAQAGNDHYRSTDAAASWTRLSGTHAGELAYAPSMPRRIYLADQNAAVSVSNDAGASFGVPVPLPASVNRLVVHPTNPDIVYAATPDGVFLSTNAGASWSSTSRGISAWSFFSVAQAPGTTGTFLASTSAAVIRSTDSGASWSTVAPYPGARVVFNPATPTTAYLCGDDSFAISTNSGASFSASTSPGINCAQLAFAGNTFFAVGSGRLRKSTNRGVTWTDAGISNAVSTVALGDSVGNVVLAASNTGVYRSTNGGTSFTQISDFSTIGVISDPQAPSHVIASGTHPSTRQCQMLLSTDGGATFSTSDSWCPSTLGATGSVLYAGGYIANNGSGGLSRSPDRGQTWVPVPLSGSLPDILIINSVAMSGDGTLYIGTSSGLYKSIDH